MKKQITRLSPQQNGKVVGIIFGITCSVFALPMILLVYLPHILNPESTQNPIAVLPMIIAPIMYFVIGYLFTIVACAMYNKLNKYIGCFEYEEENTAVSMDLEQKEEEVLIHIPEEERS